MKSFRSIDDLSERSISRFKARVFNQAMPIASAFRMLMAENDVDDTGDWKTSVYFDVFHEIYPDVELGEFVAGFESCGFIENKNDSALNDFITTLIEEIKVRSQSF